MYFTIVLQIDPADCRSTAATIEVTSTLSVSSDIVANARCGSSSMEFTARPGQQLNITITDFNHQNNPNNQRSCVNYLELTEPSGKSEPVCAGSYGRTGHVMLTSGHDVTAVFHIQDPRNQRFILTFEGKSKKKIIMSFPHTLATHDIGKKEQHKRHLYKQIFNLFNIM